MPIIFKSKLSSSVANQTFLDKTIDDIKKGKLTLYKVTLGEADQVEDVQVFLNELADVDGVVGEGDTSAKTYANHNIIADGDDRKVAIGKLDAQAQLNVEAIQDLQSLSGVGANAEDLGAFTGVTIPDSSDIKEALQSLETAHEEVDQNVNDLITLSGVAENATNLGAFDHTIIADNETVKGALQDLEDGIKAINDDYGVADGLATLDGTGKVPSTQLPSYVDDVLEYANLAAFPVTGSTGIIYVALDTNKTYRWSGTVYIEVSPSLVASVNGYTDIVVLDNTDIGLSNVTNDSQLKRAANDLNSFTSKATPDDNDILIIEDSADSFTKKKILVSSISGGAVDSVNGYTDVVVLDNADIGLGNVTNDAQLKRAANDFTTFTQKSFPVDNDVILIEDSEDTYNKKKVLLSDLGTGSGVGGINYISNYDFEKDDTGWLEYADAASESPVDGTGGTANITLTRTTTTPLRGNGSGLITKDAVNRQGQGASYDFTIDSADQAQVLRISFDYNASVDYADGDIRLYIYDVFNSRLIEVVDRDLYASSFGKFVGTFQTSSDSTSYRLIFHVASISALAYTVEIDNVIVGPQTIVKGAIVTDWESATLTGTWTTNTSYDSYYRRVGDSLEIQSTISTSGAPNAATLQVNMPSGLTIDLSKLPAVDREIGTAWVHDTTAATRTKATVETVSSSVIQFVYIGGSVITNVLPFSFGAGDSVSFTLKVPILGWSSNVVLSEDAGNREIVARYNIASTAIANTGTTIINFSNKQYDTSASVTTGASWSFSCPESGYYDVGAKVRFVDSAAFTAGTRAALYVFVNGVQTVTLAFHEVESSDAASFFMSVNGSSLLYLSKGDSVDFRAAQTTATATIALDGATTENYASIAKRSSPQTIAASEVVAASYESTNAESISTGGLGQPVIFETLLTGDTHNAYNTTTGIYTIPQSGWYHASANIRMNQDMVSTTALLSCGILLDSVYIGNHSDSVKITGVARHSRSCSGTFYAVKGQQLSVYCFQNSGASKTLEATSGVNNFSIHKISGVS
jgi:soluble P-type ATPase